MCRESEQIPADMRRGVVAKRIAILIVGILTLPTLLAQEANPYPNELNGLKFYAQYLAPLRPLQSDTKQVEMVLGSDQRLESKDWTIGAYFSCTEDFLTCSHGPRSDLLEIIEITPKHRHSMLHVSFPAPFSVSYGSVSEINVPCRIYSDAFGLEYWVVSKAQAQYKKGDLLMIRYGPRQDPQ
jgi:hypothetical protein